MNRTTLKVNEINKCLHNDISPFMIANTLSYGRHTFDTKNHPYKNRPWIHLGAFAPVKVKS